MFGSLFGMSNPFRLFANSNPNRGVGPWVTRSAGWRQKQWRKLARRTA